jgi:hypothetical protein
MPFLRHSIVTQSTLGGKGFSFPSHGKVALADKGPIGKDPEPCAPVKVRRHEKAPSQLLPPLELVVPTSFMLGLGDPITGLSWPLL